MQPNNPMHVQQIARLTGHEAAVFALATGDDPQHILSGAGEGWIVEWNLENPELGRLVAKVETNVYSLAYLPEYRRIVAGNMNGGVHWVDLTDPERTRNIAHHRKGVYAIRPYGDQVFTLGGDGILTRWSAPEARAIESLHLSPNSLRSLDIDFPNELLVIGGSDKNIYVLDAATFSIRHTLHNAHENSVFSARFSPDGRYLVSGGRDAILKVWDRRQDYKLVHAIPAHWYTINDIAFHPNGSVFASASRDKTIKIWDARDFQLLKVIDTLRNKCHIRSVNALCWSSYHNYLLSCSDDRSIMIWELS